MIDFWQSLLLISLVLCVTRSDAAALSLQNITISVPIGASDHGDQHLLCVPQRATVVATFFLVNYLAHAATLKPIPGQPIVPAFLDLILTLFFPGYGIIRGLNSICENVFRGKTALETALKAGALCEVVRTKHWRPRKGDRIHNLHFCKNSTSHDVLSIESTFKSNPSKATGTVPFTQNDLAEAKRRSGDAALQDGVNVKGPKDDMVQKDGRKRNPQILLNVSVPLQRFSHDTLPFRPANSFASPNGRKVHGQCQLPDGFALSVVSRNAIVHPLQSHKASQPDTWSESMKIPNTLWISLLNRLGIRSHRPRTPGAQEASSFNLSSSYNFTKALIAILQLLFATYTLVQTRGDQIDRFGYAAFGLTVAPYLIMSFINLLSSLLAPDYSHIYLVRSKVMEEAENHGGYFNGYVGTLEQEAKHRSLTVDFVEQGSKARLVAKDHETGQSASGQDRSLYVRGVSDKDKAILRQQFNSCEDLYPFTWPSDNSDWLARTRRNILELEPWKSPLWTIQSNSDSWSNCTHDPKHAHIDIPSGSTLPSTTDNIRRFRFLLVASIVIGSSPIAVVGALSHFQRGDRSTRAQQAWTMSWLAAGILIGPLSYFLPQGMAIMVANSRSVLLFRLALLLYSVPAIGGFVAVSQMIWDYGNCTKLY